ncbi:MAG: alpha/beta fold hydrolase [Gammaproteobacteria bacterium]|nr:alpha/beta fold hydrolase [Gammaproteobacteria bacterium]
MTQWPAFSARYHSDDFASDLATLQLNELWQQAEHGYFDSIRACDGTLKASHHSTESMPAHLQLHYSYWQPTDAIAALVLIPGRIEAGHKYLEFIGDALDAGYQVFVLDHQGQGASARLNSHSQIGDIASFSDYVTDLENFIQHIVKPKTTLPLLAIAHSMGGGILCRYLQQQPNHHFAAAIFCSPMWGITTSPVPGFLALPLSRVMSQLNHICSRQRWYLPGQGPYENRPFADNDLSHCQERYQWFRSLYQQYPTYQLGGVSWRWLAEALTACQAMQKDPAPQLPCLLLQAGADQVVDNQAQSQLWQRFRQDPAWSTASAQHLIPEARHELLFETDIIRLQCLTLINQFLAQVGTTIV